MPSRSPHRHPVLCGTDFSAAATEAADAAAALAKALRVPLRLVHAFEPVGWWPVRAGGGAGQQSAARRALNSEADRLRAFGCAVRAELLLGKPHAVLQQVTSSGGVSLLVLGAGAASTRPFLGNTAERAVALAAVPVLVVRRAAPLVRWIAGRSTLRLFAAFDFSQASEAALSWLPLLTRVHACHVTVGFAHGEQGREADRRHDWRTAAPRGEGTAAGLARDIEARATPLLGAVPDAVAVTSAADGTPAGLNAMAERARAELIVVGSHATSAIDQVWDRSLSRALLRDTRTNVLCVPARAAGQLIPAVPRPGRLLVGVDFSAPSLRAVAYACALAGPDTSIRLAHVTHPRAIGGGAAHGGLRRSPAHGAHVVRERSRLDQVRRRMPRPDARTDDTAVVEDEDVAAGLCAEADRFGADLVVLGTLGLTGIQRAATGSIAGQVLQRCGRPVLVVRAPRA